MIRLPDIPGLQETRIDAPQVSLAAATAPSRALGSVAQGFANLSESFEGIAERIQSVENARAESTARLQWTEGYANLKLELAKDPDPLNHQRRVAEYLQQQKATLDDPDLAPVVRDRLALQYDDFAGRAKMDTARDAAALAVRRGTLALNNEFDQAMQTGNRGTFERAKETALEHGIILPEQAVSMEREFEDRTRKNQLLRQAMEQPDIFLTEQPENAPEAEDPVFWQQLRSTAKRAIAGQTAQATAEIQDGIAAGNITRPEQIDELAPDLRPAAREALKEDLARRADANHQAIVRTPAYQATTVAKVSEMLDAYDVESDGFDTAYVEMDSLVRTLPAGAVKTELSRRLAEVRDGQLRQLETSADFHRQALDDLHKQGAFGTTDPVKTDIRPFIDAGLLSDAKKLRTLGFSTDQAKDIAKLEDPKQTAEFRRLWHQREDAAGALTGTPIYRVAEAHAMRQTELETTDLAAREKARRAYGAAKTKLENWLKANPDATEQAGRQKLLEITGELAIPGAVESILDAPPTFLDGPGVLPPKPTE